MYATSRPRPAVASTRTGIRLAEHFRKKREVADFTRMMKPPGTDFIIKINTPFKEILDAWRSIAEMTE
jgi:hypothetical protein